MNAVLDYDALEMLGAAIREAGVGELNEPMGAELLALCRRLEAADDSPEAPRQSHFAGLNG